MMLNKAPSEKKDAIMVVEDNAELRNFIASGFARYFNVITAGDGEEGLVLAFEHIPDLIISDVMMPKMNGLEFIDCVKQDERTSHIPVILLTARTDGESRMDGFRKGVDDYIAKPFSVEELWVRTINLIQQRKQLALKYRKEIMNPKTDIRTELSLDEKFLLNVKAIIEKNIGNSSFGVEMLANEVNLSRAQLFRKLKALINTTPSEFINDIRLSRAAQLIKAKSDNVAQIGYAVGFSEQSYFAKRFRKKYGVSPGEYSQ